DPRLVVGEGRQRKGGNGEKGERHDLLHAILLGKSRDMVHSLSETTSSSTTSCGGKPGHLGSRWLFEGTSSLVEGRAEAVPVPSLDQVDELVEGSAGSSVDLLAVRIEA